MAYFTKALAYGRVHHAYLFQGPEHVGKTTFARMLAQTLLCESDKVIPCGKCRACEAYARAAHPDFLVVDRGEAEHLSIEKIREGIAALNTKPLLGSVRVAIIEEASRLTIEAGSALLKTLEEPGASVVLFLIAHADVLPTIASRCQRIQFGWIPTREKVETQEAEEVLAMDEAKKLLWVSARFSRGSVSIRREECGLFLRAVQHALRERLAQEPRHAVMLKKTLEAEAYLKANVDPRLVCEYVLLS